MGDDAGGRPLGLARLLEARGGVRRVASPDQVAAAIGQAPSASRARVRGRLVAAARAHDRAFAVDRGTFSVHDLPDASVARPAPVDLVLAEIRMTPMSGLDLLRLIRDDVSLKETPVVLITGRSDSAGAVEGFAAGADDVVAKPFHIEVLAARIARRIARARADRDLAHDKATLDARVVTRAIELGEVRQALEASEAERIRLARLVNGG